MSKVTSSGLGDDLEGFEADRLKRAILGLTKFLSKKEEDVDLLEMRGCPLALSFNLARVPPGVRSKPLAM